MEECTALDQLADQEEDGSKESRMIVTKWACRYCRPLILLLTEASGKNWLMSCRGALGCFKGHKFKISQQISIPWPLQISIHMHTSDQHSYVPGIRQISISNSVCIVHTADQYMYAYSPILLITAVSSMYDIMLLYSVMARDVQLYIECRCFLKLCCVLLLWWFSPLPTINWGASGCPRFPKGRGLTITTPTYNRKCTGKASSVRPETLGGTFNWEGSCQWLKRRGGIKDSQKHN